MWELEATSARKPSWITRRDSLHAPLEAGMTAPSMDPSLVFSWQAAHSIARGAPSPVPDRGGFRVDTRSEKETTRWVFPQLCEGLYAIAADVTEPRHFLKLCGTGEELGGALPPRWAMQPANYFMWTADLASDAQRLPDGYGVEVLHEGPVAQVRITAPDGSLAASGQAAESSGVFVYDRIETAERHRRKGLGATVMAVLGAARKSQASLQLLVATEEGRHLYQRLGWTVLSPFATAVIPEG